MTTWTAATEQTEAWTPETRVPGSGAFAAGQFDADAFDVATIWDPWVAAGEDIEAWAAIEAAASNCPGRDAEVAPEPEPDSFVTWDAATASDMALTNGDLTATNTAADIVCGVMATSSHTTGKYYFEITLDIFLDNDQTFGVATTSATYDDLYLTGTGGVTAYFTGRIYTDGIEAPGVLFNGFEAGDTMAVAVDLDNRKIWVNNIDGPNAPGDWNGVPGADPATNTDGVTILAGTILPFCTFGGTPGDFIGQAWTANFGDSAFFGAVPSGFTSGWSA